MAMNKFTEIAKNATALSPIMDNRTKISTEEMIRRYPDGFTVIEFDVLTTKKGSFPVLAIKEDPEVCFFGGAVLNTITQAWLASCGGDIKAASNELTECGGVQMKLHMTKTKDGNNLTAVDIL